MTTSEDLRLSPFYLNTRRLNAVFGSQIPSAAQVSINQNSGARADAMSLAGQVATELLRSGKISLLTPDMLEETKTNGPVIAQLWDVFVFKGLPASIESETKGKSKPAGLRADLSIGGIAYTLNGELITDHHYSVSTASELSGKKRMLVAGQFELKDDKIIVSPYIIGNLLKVDHLSHFDMPWSNSVRVYPEQIDAFSKCNDARRVSAGDIEKLGEMPEAAVKDAFAEIIGEPFVPKDWGGEKSDLQTNNLAINGTSASAAFMFKGPGVKGELHPNNLGKRGDQIVRAFDEPVDLVVVQYHNKIANTVVRQAESFACNPANPKRYCILDGADTVRILSAYGKF